MVGVYYSVHYGIYLGTFLLLEFFFCLLFLEMRVEKITGNHAAHLLTAFEILECESVHDVEVRFASHFLRLLSR